QSLGKPSDLRKLADEHRDFSGRLAEHDRAETLRGVAEKTGVKFSVLKALATPALAFGEGKAKGRDGKDTSFVTVKDGEAEPVPFDEYLSGPWKEFEPALRPGA